MKRPQKRVGRSRRSGNFKKKREGQSRKLVEALEPNRRVIETHIRYLVEQGLISKLLSPEEIFARDTS